MTRAFRLAIVNLLAASSLCSAEDIRRVHVACFVGSPDVVEAFAFGVESFVPFRVQSVHGEAPEAPGERCVLTLLQQNDAEFTRFFELPRHDIATHEHIVAAFRDQVQGPTIPDLEGEEEPVYSASGVYSKGVADRRNLDEIQNEDDLAVALILDTMMPVDEESLAQLRERMERPLQDLPLVEEAALNPVGNSAGALHQALSVLTELRNHFDENFFLCDAGSAEMGRSGKHVLFRDPGIHVHMEAAAEIAATTSFRSTALLSKVCGVLAILILSDAPGAVHVEKLEQETTLNGEANFVVQSGVDGYLPIWNRQIYGAGEVIGVSDTGLDQDTCFMRDAEKGPVPVSDAVVPVTDLSRRKVVQYLSFSRGDGQDIDDGHGTHVTGSALGGMEGSSPGETKYDGVAFLAKTAFFDLQDEATAQSSPNAIRTPPDITDIYESAFTHAGARLHTNSWGAATTSAYDSRSRLVDRFMYDHDDLLILYAAGNCGENIGGCIVSGDGSIFSPAIAKNVLSVGASHTGDGAYTKSIDRVAYFSSRGCSSYDNNASPSSNCRIKPDVLGPGFVVRSAAADPLRASCSVYTSAGTSMATPVVAGAAALIREYFRRGFYPFGAEDSGPEILASGMLIKAMLVASAVGVEFLESSSGELTPLGPPPDNIQGHGRVKLDNVLPFGRLGLLVQDRRTISEGEVHTFEVVVALSSAIPLTATIVWYESGQSFSSFNSNDLDVRIEEDVASGGSGVYYPNGLSEPDRVNNVEKVYLDPVPGRKYNVFVTGSSVESAGQWNYSLVVSGDLASADALTAPPTAAPVASPTKYPTRSPSANPTSSTLYRVAATCFFCDAAPSESLTTALEQAVRTSLQSLSSVETEVSVDASAAVVFAGDSGVAFAFHAAVAGPLSDAEEIRDVIAESTVFLNSTLDLTESATGETYSCFQVWNVTISAAPDQTTPTRREESEKLGVRTRNVIIYFQTAVGLTAMSGISLLLVVLMLGYSAYVGCCADPQRDLSITEMPHLWTERLHAWHARQQENRPSHKTRTLKRSARREREELESLRRRGATWRPGGTVNSPLVAQRKNVRSRQEYDEEKAEERHAQEGHVEEQYAEEKKVQVIYPGATPGRGVPANKTGESETTISPITGTRGPHRSPAHARTNSQREGDALQAVIYEAERDPKYLRKSNPMRHGRFDQRPEITIITSGNGPGGEDKRREQGGAPRGNSPAPGRDRHMETAIALGRPPALEGVRQQVAAYRRSPVTHPTKRSMKKSTKVVPTRDLPTQSEDFRRQLQSLRQVGATQEEAVQAITAFNKNPAGWSSPVDLWLSQTTSESLGRAMHTTLSGELQDFDSDDEDEPQAEAAEAAREREQRANAEYRDQLQRLQALGAPEPIAIDAIETWEQNRDKYDSPEEVWMQWTTPESFGKLQKQKKKKKKENTDRAAQSREPAEAKEMRSYGFADVADPRDASPERKAEGKKTGRWSTSYLLNI